jgi:hypothetical protein
MLYTKACSINEGNKPHILKDFSHKPISGDDDNFPNLKGNNGKVVTPFIFTSFALSES